MLHASQQGLFVLQLALLSTDSTTLGTSSILVAVSEVGCTPGGL